ncbi:MAG: hypothetical protein ACE361_10290 [Aureliella sp.]
MVRKSIGLALMAGFAFSAGCSLCPEGYLDDYATVGGKWPRANPTHGRVGSVLSDAGVMPAGPAPGYDGVVGQEYYYEDSYYSDTPYSAVEPLNAPEVPGTILEAPIGQ